MIVFVNASGCIYTSKAATYWPSAGIVDGLGVSGVDVRETGKILQQTLVEVGV